MDDFDYLLRKGEMLAKRLLPKLKADGFIIAEAHGNCIRVIGVTAYGGRITGISVSINPDVIRGDMHSETLTLGPGKNGRLEITYTDEAPYYGDVRRFYTYEELKEHLMFATGRRYEPVDESEDESEDESTDKSEDESTDESEEEEVDTVETVETVETIDTVETIESVDTVEGVETSVAPPPPPTDCETPVPPVPPLPLEMGIMELGAKLVKLLQDRGPMMNSSEENALVALLNMMKTDGADRPV